MHDYLLFHRAFSITSQGPLDYEKLQELVNIRASLNRGLTPVLKEAFPLTIPTFVDKSTRKMPDIPSGDWVAGFTTGEGHFSVYISKPRGYMLNVSVVVSFVLTQHSRDKQLMENLVKYFGCGNYYLRSDVDAKRGRL